MSQGLTLHVLVPYVCGAQIFRLSRKVFQDALALNINSISPMADTLLITECIRLSMILNLFLLHLQHCSKCQKSPYILYVKESSLQLLKQRYSRRMCSIPWLRMPWLLVSPGHQLPCYMYWYWNIHGSSSSMMKVFNEPKSNPSRYREIFLMILFKKFSMWGINSLWPSDTIWWHRFGSTLRS